MKNLFKVLAVSLFSLSALAQRGQQHSSPQVFHNNRGYFDQHGHVFGTVRPGQIHEHYYGANRDYRYGTGFYGYHGFVSPIVVRPYYFQWNTYGCDTYSYYNGLCLPYDYYYEPYSTNSIINGGGVDGEVITIHPR